jgi:PKD repeat protein
LTYAWDFGDGTTAAASSVTTLNHTYTTSGAFTVTVTVDDGTGLPGHTYVATNVIHVPGTTTPPAPSA